MVPYRLPPCKQCNGHLALFGDEFRCNSCGMPHPEVRMSAEEDMPPAVSEPPLSEATNHEASGEVKRKPGRPRKS